MVYVPPKYPSAIPTIGDLPNRQDDVDWLVAARYNELKKELRACLTELGVLPKGADADVVARLNRIQAEIDALGDADPGEGHITLLPLSYVSIGQGSWVLALGATYYLGGSFYNTPPVDGDEITWALYLAKGTYDLLLVCKTFTDIGIVDFDLNAVEIASFDLYSGGAVQNVRKVEQNIVVAASGVKLLTMRVDGKNVLSTNYYVLFSCISLWRTA